MTARLEPQVPPADEGIAGEIPRCARSTAAGEPCQVEGKLLRWNEDAEAWLCIAHDPSRAEEFRNGSVRGGLVQGAKQKRHVYLLESDLGPLETPADAKRWASKLALAVATGRLTAGAASVVKALLEQFVRSLEAVDLDERLAALEQKVVDDEARRQRDVATRAAESRRSGSGYLTTSTPKGNGA